MLKRLALALPFLVACTSSGQSTGIDSVSCPTDSTLTYANFGSTFIDSNCLECHAGKERPNLSTQAAIQSHKNSILQEAVYTDAMPQDNTMTTAERQMLGEWLACGAP
jgi:uncharacterized membrane protein